MSKIVISIKNKSYKRALAKTNNNDRRLLQQKFIRFAHTAYLSLEISLVEIWPRRANNKELSENKLKSIKIIWKQAKRSR